MIVRVGRSPERRHRLRRGFTLTELLIAIILLTVGIIGTASVMISTTTGQSISSVRAEMTDLAASKLEQFRAGAEGGNATIIAALAFGGSITTMQSGYSETVTGASGRTYQRLWIVETGPSFTHKVTVRVRPVTATSRTAANVDLVTLILTL